MQLVTFANPLRMVEGLTFYAKMMKRKEILEIGEGEESDGDSASEIRLNNQSVKVEEKEYM
jgi:hypothetical protein